MTATLRSAALATLLVVSTRSTSAIAQSAWPDTAVDGVHLLDDTAFGFLYELPVPEWPTGWSFYAASPNDASVYHGDWSFADPFTGAPRFDLLPSQFAHAPSAGLSARPGGTAVWFDRRSFNVGLPLTDVMYWTSDKGLQSVRIVHVQRRAIGIDEPNASAARMPTDSLAADSTAVPGADSTSMIAASADTFVVSDSTPAAGSPRREVTAALTYHGAAATGEYPGSRVRRARQIGGFVNLSGRRWSLQVFELYNRRSVGAHGGVNPPVFERLGASVRTPTAIRETRRNDLAAEAALLVLDAPATVGAAWTEATLRYTTSSDTIEARTRALSWYARQEIGGVVPVAIVARGSGAALRGARGLLTSDATVHELFAGAETSYASDAVDFSGTIGYATSRGQGLFAAHATLSVTAGPLVFGVGGVRAALPQTIVQTTGFGEALTPIESAGQAATTTRAESRIGLLTDMLAVDLSAFVASSSAAIDYLSTATEDSVTVAEVVSPELGGISFGFSFREPAAAGVYLRARVDTYARLSGRIAPPESPATDDRLARTVPEYYARAQIGFRQTLFQGDLRADLFVRGRAWPAFGSRELHPQTGLLVVPTLGSDVPAAGVVDAGIRAGIRTATIFLLYENVLSGTRHQEGVMMVDGYPLEERRVRFGVHWPIVG